MVDFMRERTAAGAVVSYDCNTLKILRVIATGNATFANDCSSLKIVQSIAKLMQ